MADRLELSDIESWEYCEQETVYDISVEGTHCYFLDCGKNILVHNSSKTYSTLQLLYHIAERHNLHISVVSESMPHLKKGAMKDYKSILENDGIYDESKHNKTDSIFRQSKGLIEFFSADQSDKVRGPRRDILYINECNSLSWETYYQLASRTGKTVFLDFNPVQSFWVHEKLIPSLQPDEFRFIKSTYRDNDQLPEKIIRDIERRALVDSNYKTVYADGEIGNLEGLIFTNWIQCDTMPETDKRVIGVDFGFTNDPTVITDLRLNDGDLWADTVVFQTGLLNSDIIRIIKGMNLNKHIQVICDGSEPKSVAELQLAGINAIPAVKGAGSVNAGIDRLKQYRIHITSRSTEAIKEARSYQWQVDKNGKTTNEPQDFNNHFWDSVRYAGEGLFNLNAKKKARFIFD